MDLKEFQLFKAACFIKSPFSTCWSGDNFIATATDKGVHVVQLKFGAKKKQELIETHRWLIKPRLVAPSSETLIDSSTLLKSISVKETFLCMLDATLSPKAPLTGLNPTVRYAQWSSIHLVLHDSSLLGVLTDLGSLDIYGHEGDDWSIKTSISDAWVKHCKLQWDPLLDVRGSALYATHSERAYKLKFMAFSWGVYENEDLPILFCSNMKGEILSWKIKPKRSMIEPELMNIIDSGLEYATRLTCLPLKEKCCRLVACCVSGRIQCLDVNTEGKEEARVSIWPDHDMMQSGPAFKLKNPPKGMLIAVPKSGFLLVFWLDADGSLVSFAVHDSSDINITGLVPLDHCDTLMTTTCGDILHVSVDFDDDNLLVISDKWHSSLRTKAHACLGIVASHNKAIIGLAYSLASTFDHLLIRDHCQVILCLQPGKVKVKEVLGNESSASLYDDWDCLEVIRLECTLQNQEMLFEFNEKYLSGSIDINILRKAYWLNKFSLSVLTDQTKIDELVAMCDDMRKVIISHFLFQRLSIMVSDCLSDEEKSDLSLTLMWLEYVKTTLPDYYGPTKEGAQSFLEQLTPFADGSEEKCPFCENTCLLVNEELVMKCLSGHEVPRCMFTLLPVHRIPYYHCIQCGELSISMEFPGIEPAGRCIICDGRLKTETCLQEDF